MEITPPPRLVALDTQVFESQKFNYESNVFQKLISLSKEEKIKILITTVTDQEIRAHITEGAQLISTALKQAVKNIKRNKFGKKNDESKQISRTNTSDKLYEYKQLIESAAPSFEDINSELLGKFDDFLSEAKVTILKINQVPSDLVFQSYFLQSPPFREGRKKSEFPDAFALFSLKAEAENQDRILYIVSGDSDWINFCKENNEFLIGLESIDNLLEKIIREDESEDEIEKCYEFLEDNIHTVKQEITNQFPELDFSVDLSSLGYVEWGTEEIETTVISVVIQDTSLIDIDESDSNELQIIFELQVKVEFTADVSFFSLEFAIYDKEDDRYYGGETIDIQVDQSIDLPVEVSLSVSRDKDYTLSSGDIGEVILDPNGLVGCISVTTGWEDEY